jgi:hypothetical protein
MMMHSLRFKIGDVDSSVVESGLSIGVALFEPHSLAVNLRGRLVGEVCIMLPSHAGDEVVEPMLTVA